MDRSRKIPLALIFVLAGALAAAFWQALAGPGSLSAAPSRAASTSAPPARENTWYAVYFTDRELDGFRGGPDEPLIAAIQAARLSVDVAVFDLDLWGLRDALIAAHRRGVTVRVVTETDNADNPEIQALIEAGIPVVQDNSEGLMHNKFAIIDRQSVWTGSMNFTLNGAYRNDNDLIRITSPEVAAAYLIEFEEMFVERRFGAGSPANTPNEFSVNGTPLEVYFSPEDGVLARLVALIQEARDSITFLAFSFTANELREAMLARARQGVQVRGVFDEGQASGTGSEYQTLLANGLDVYLDRNPDKLHFKTIIIDERIVITGSYNFSASAEERNDENVLVIFSPEIAGLYLQEAGRVLGEAAR